MPHPPISLPPASAIIFDLDGVLADSNRLHIKAWRQTLAGLGLNYSDAGIQALIAGRRNPEIVLQIQPGLTLPQAETLARGKEERFRLLAAAELSAVKGALDFLRALRHALIPCAVATSAPRENCLQMLAQLQMLELVQATVTEEDVRKGKPDPEVFLLAAARLGVAPRECIVFEDAAAGVRAARAAGMRCIGIAGASSAADLSACGAETVLSDFEELSHGQLRIDPKVSY